MRPHPSSLSVPSLSFFPTSSLHTQPFTIPQYLTMEDQSKLGSVAIFCMSLYLLKKRNKDNWYTMQKDAKLNLRVQFQALDIFSKMSEQVKSKTIRRNILNCMESIFEETGAPIQERISRLYWQYHQTWELSVQDLPRVATMLRLAETLKRVRRRMNDTTAGANSFGLQRNGTLWATQLEGWKQRSRQREQHRLLSLD